MSTSGVGRIHRFSDSWLVALTFVVALLVAIDTTERSYKADRLNGICRGVTRPSSDEQGLCPLLDSMGQDVTRESMVVGFLMVRLLGDLARNRFYLRSPKSIV